MPGGLGDVVRFAVEVVWLGCWDRMRSFEPQRLNW